MTIFEAKTYYDFINHVLYGGAKTKRRGIVKELAQKLQCHSTFISQVAYQKAHFNHDQAIRFCTYSNLSKEETEFFLDLLNRDRSSSLEARQFFQTIIEQKLLEQQSLHTRDKIVPDLTLGQEAIYFKSWYIPIVHAALLIPGFNKPDIIAAKLKIDETVVQEALELLERIGVAEKKNDRYRALKDLLYIDPKSPLNDSHQAGWRLKTGSLLLERKKTREHTHATAIVSISNETAKEIQEILLKDMSKIRKKVEASSSERLYVFCIDFYPLK